MWTHSSYDKYVNALKITHFQNGAHVDFVNKLNKSVIALSQYLNSILTSYKSYSLIGGIRDIFKYLSGNIFFLIIKQYYATKSAKGIWAHIMNQVLKIETLDSFSHQEKLYLFGNIFYIINNYLYQIKKCCPDVFSNHTIPLAPLIQTIKKDQLTILHLRQTFC